MSTRVAGIWLVLLAANGCGSERADDSAGRALLAGVADPGGLPEFRHTLDVSRFRVGPSALERKDGAWSKRVGPEGVFAVNLANGAVRATPNGDAPAMREPALTTQPEKHNARVRDYFVTAGLPADQVGGAQVTTLMKVDGFVGQLSGDVRPEFVAYTTILNRAVDGIPILGSFAWARFNARDEVMAEAVYWPRIPGAVVAEAQTLRARLADPATAAAYYKALPTGNAPGRVVIRHTSSITPGAPVAFACFDVIEPSGSTLNHRTSTRHFDAAGVERTVTRSPLSRDWTKVD